MTWIKNPADKDDLIWLNVRGNIGFFKKQLLDLVPDSDLFKLFTGQMPDVKYIDGKPFLNKDPEGFKNVISYLANGMVLPKLDNFRQGLLLEDLDFWKITYHIPTAIEKMDEVFKKVPQRTSKAALSKWVDELGHLEIAKMVQKKMITVDLELHVVYLTNQTEMSTGISFDYFGQLNARGRRCGLGRQVWKGGKIYEGLYEDD